MQTMASLFHLVRVSAVAIPLVLIPISCTTADGVFDPGRMTSTSPDGAPEYSESYTIEAIENLQPQLQFPITLAISQPSSWKGWSAKELALIESWKEPLRASGFVKDLIILPESLSKTCGWRMAYQCGIWPTRALAARFRADAVLMMAANTETVERSTPLSVFNLTILGMWLVPGHERHAVTVLEGSLVDTRNEYLYVFARAYGESKLIRPLIYADRQQAIRKSRLAALQDFGERMIAQVQNTTGQETTGQETTDQDTTAQGATAQDAVKN